MNDERLAVIRAMIALTDVGDAQFAAITELLAEVERLRAENAGLQRIAEEATTYHAGLMSRYIALRNIVEVVAEADNSDHGVCYQLCSYDIAWVDDEHQVMTHNTPCVAEQARALLDA